MIAVMYIGQRRYASMRRENHQVLVSKLEQIAPVVKYDFTRELNQPSPSPWQQSGGIQIFDFLEGVEKVKENIVVKFRSDLWFTGSAMDAIVKEVKLVVDDMQDASFIGCNWKDYIGHTYTKEHISEKPWVQDFVVVVNKNVLKDKKEIYQNIESSKPSKRACGTKWFRSMLTTQARAYNVMSQVYLIRKQLPDNFDPWQVGYDYIFEDMKRFGHKMPDAMPWYMSTKI